MHSALFTAKEALAGFALGAVVGFLLAVAFSQWKLLERGFLPYIVASQTIPIQRGNVLVENRELVAKPRDRPVREAGAPSARTSAPPPPRRPLSRFWTLSRYLARVRYWDSVQ